MGIKQANINLVKGRINLRSRLFQTRPTKCRLEVIQPFKSNSDADITQFVENASQLELLDTVQNQISTLCVWVWSTNFIDYIEAVYRPTRGHLVKNKHLEGAL